MVLKLSFKQMDNKENRKVKKIIILLTLKTNY